MRRQATLASMKVGSGVLERPERPRRRVGGSTRAVALTCTLLAVSAPHATAQDSIAAHRRYAGVARDLARFIEAERLQKGIPALSVALVDGERIVWAQGFGWADSVAGTRATASTTYRVGSVSKLFTDIGIMRLVEQGTLALDVPIQRYLPDFRPRN